MVVIPSPSNRDEAGQRPPLDAPPCRLCGQPLFMRAEERGVCGPCHKMKERPWPVVEWP